MPNTHTQQLTVALQSWQSLSATEQELWINAAQQLSPNSLGFLLFVEQSLVQGSTNPELSDTPADLDKTFSTEGADKPTQPDRHPPSD